MSLISEEVAGTLLTVLYAFCDDHVVEPRRIGRPPRLSDAELLCLAIAQVLLGFVPTRHWIRFVGSRLGYLSAYVPGQSGCNCEDVVCSGFSDGSG